MSRNMALRIRALSGSISAAIDYGKSKASSILSAEYMRIFLANLVDPDKAPIYTSVRRAPLKDET